MGTAERYLRALRKRAGDVVAIAVLVAIALVTTWIVLQNQGLRIPVLEERPFELKAELETVQGVEPGQGQALRVAGVRVVSMINWPVRSGRSRSRPHPLPGLRRCGARSSPRWPWPTGGSGRLRRR